MGLVGEVNEIIHLKLLEQFLAHSRHTKTGKSITFFSGLAERPGRKPEWPGGAGGSNQELLAFPRVADYSQ